jgi:hypothetical protein
MDMPRRLRAEFFGTFWLTFAGCGNAVLAAGFVNIELTRPQLLVTAQATFGIGRFGPAKSAEQCLHVALNGRGDTHQICPLLKVNRPCHLAAVTSQFDPS